MKCGVDFHVGLLDDSNDVAVFYDEVFIAVNFDLNASVFVIHDAVADFYGNRVLFLFPDRQPQLLLSVFFPVLFLE